MTRLAMAAMTIWLGVKLIVRYWIAVVPQSNSIQHGATVALNGSNIPVLFWRHSKVSIALQTSSG